MKKYINLSVFIAIVMLFSSCSNKQEVSMILYNGSIYTVDSAFTVAQAMAIADGKIVATGSNQDIMKNYRSDQQIDLKGKYVYPGFIDAHCHFTGYATDMWKCDLTGTKSFSEIINKLVEYSKTAPMEWLYGRGWDQNDWPEKSFPDKRLLDSLFPNRPVFLKRIDGHAALVNQKALDLAGVTVDTKLKGGEVEIRSGVLTGILVDNAMDLVDRIIPQPDDALTKKYYLAAQQNCFAVGLTGVHDCGISEHTIRLVDEEQKAGKLKMKIFALLSDSAQYYDKWIRSGPYITPYLHVGGFKLYADGALGSRGACLIDDYSDKPGWRGFLLSDVEHFKDVASKLIKSNLQMCTHAIGDSGNRTILNVYANVLGGKNDRRWRIEHAQVINENDFDLFGKYSIIPSVQPTHATSDMYWAGERLGAARLKNAYANLRLLKQNGWIALGTDFPVEDISPIKTFYAAVVREDANGYPPGGFQIENALSREQALRGMTIWAAKAAFEENEKGCLEKGKAADMVILDTDLLHCADMEILRSKVWRTYINGEPVFGN